MKPYHTLLLEKQMINHDIKESKKYAHQQFVFANKTLFFYLDMAVVLMVLFNFGAAAITNVLVVKKTVAVNETPLLYEVNPVRAELGDYEVHPESKQIISKQVYVLFAAWVLLISTYVYYRRTVFTEEGLILLLIPMTLLFIILGWDFFNDLGYWIGKLLYMIK